MQPVPPTPDADSGRFRSSSQRWRTATIGPYRVVEEVGRGGVGSVWRAEAPDGRAVALKLLLAGRGARPEQRRRFEGEARALLRLRHPHVVAILDAGEHEGCPWLAMEWVQGRTLAERVERGGALPPAEAVALGLRLAQALAHCHAQGVVHRDLTPRNVLLREPEGVPLLTDFGLAKDLLPGEGSQSLGLTVGGRFLGTPGFWPPEQARGQLQRIGPRSDVYGLGALLYFALTGEAPQRGRSLGELLSSLEAPVPPPSRSVPEVPAWLDALVLRCLAVDPQRRPAGADEVAAALEAGVSGRGPRPASRAWRVGALALGAGAALGAVLLLAAWQRDARRRALRDRAEELIAAPAPGAAALRELLAALESLERPGEPGPLLALRARLELELAHAGNDARAPAEEVERHLQAASAEAGRDRRLRALLQRERERLEALRAAAQARATWRSAWRDRGAVEAAFAHAIAVAEVEPGLVRELRLDRARYRWRRGAWDAAIQEGQALQAERDQVGGEAGLVVALSLLGQGWFGEARQAMEAVAAGWPEDSIPGLKARAMVSGFPDADPAVGARATAEVVRRQPDDLESLVLDLEYRARASGDLRACLVALEALGPRCGDDPSVALLEITVADLLGESRRADEAAARAEELVCLDRASVWIQRGFARMLPWACARKEVEPHAAVRDFTRAAQLAPGSPVPQLLRDSTRVNAGDLDAVGEVALLGARYPAETARFVDNLPPHIQGPLRLALTAAGARLGGR